MKKTIAALFIATFMAISLTACGGSDSPANASDEKPELFDYQVPEASYTYMPDSIETIEDMKEACKYVIASAFEGEYTYNGIPLGSMNKAYFMNELEKDGFETKEVTKLSFTSRNGEYNIAGSSAVVGGPVQSVDLRVYGTYEEGFDSAILDRINSHITIGASAHIIGKSIDEILDYLCISDDMLLFLEQKDYSYYWYDGVESYWCVRFDFGKDIYNNPQITLHLARNENGYEQSMDIITTNDYCEAIKYEEDPADEKDREIFVTGAKLWYARNELMGPWTGTEHYADGKSVMITGEEANLRFDSNTKGYIALPWINVEEAPMEWLTSGVEETEKGDVILFRVDPNVPDQLNDSMPGEYNQADGTVKIYNPDQSQWVLFKKQK